MSDHLTHACGGTWRPMPHWSSRYRCDGCGIIGYRSAAVRGDASLGIKASEHIVPYRCSYHKCDRGAVRKVAVGRSGLGPRKWRCPDHSETAQ